MKRLYYHDTLEYRGGIVGNEFKNNALATPQLIERYKHYFREQFWFPIETLKKILAIDRFHIVPDSFFIDIIRENWVDIKDERSIYRCDKEGLLKFIKNEIFELSTEDFFRSNTDYRQVQRELNNIFISEAGFWHLANNFQWKISTGLLAWLNKNVFVSMNLRINTERGK